MKKIISTLLSLSMMLSFTACDEEEKGEISYNSTSATEQTEEILEYSEDEDGVYDAGYVMVDVPEGWKGFPVYDQFNGGVVNENSLKISKGAKIEQDLNYTPYIQFNFYSSDKEFHKPTIGMYGNNEGKELSPIVTGKYTWQALELVIDTDLILKILYTEDEMGNHYVANVWAELVGGKFSLEDSDVIEILESVRPSK